MMKRQWPWLHAATAALARGLILTAGGFAVAADEVPDPQRKARVDDGVILVIAKDDHKLRIEVGRGLEGAIPDVLAKRVIREVIAPHFLNGDFHGGIADGTATLMKLVAGEALPPP